MRVILFFIDGLGLAPAGIMNPLTTTPTPCLNRLLDGQDLTLEAVGTRTGISTLLSLDATLGVAGEPQSATGQTTLLTGVNAPKTVGRHVRGFPTVALRKLLEEEGLSRKVLALGKSVNFLNSYRPGYFVEEPRHNRAYSVTTWLNCYAGLPFHPLTAMDEGLAVCHDITNEFIKEELHCDATYVTPEAAGKILARNAKEVDFLFFEHFLTDTYGHKRDLIKIAATLTIIDRFLTGVFNHLDLLDTLFILTSDHGNIEDLTTSAHTRNPVPLLLVGAGRENLPKLVDLTDVTPLILDRLEVERG